ncbi:hypothetical protein V1291_001505 [Nitrobacteraceae bacterium AZCC 1564]
MKYLFDSNVFIEAKNRYYAFDICPGFWDWMDHVAKADAGSIVNVCDELRQGRDELAKWANARRTEPWFLKVDDASTQKFFQSVANFVNLGAFKQAAKAKFLSGADPWLIAKAKIVGAKVVTHEVSAPDSKNRVPIPDVCKAFDIECTTPYEALRSMAASFTFKIPA